MTFPSIDRRHAATLLIGALLVVFTLTIVGAVLALVSQPALRALQNSANAWVGAGASVVNLVSVAIVYFLMARAHAMSARKPGTIWSRNADHFAAARLVALVYMALIPVNLLVGEFQSLLQIQAGNVLQVDMFGGAGLIFTTAVLPIIGIVLVLIFAPRFTKTSE